MAVDGIRPNPIAQLGNGFGPRIGNGFGPSIEDKTGGGAGPNGPVEEAPLPGGLADRIQFSAPETGFLMKGQQVGS
jgi:hypothetical protein